MAGESRWSTFVLSAIGAVGLVLVAGAILVVRALYPREVDRPSWSVVEDSLGDLKLTIPHHGEPRDLKEGNGPAGNSRDLRIDHLSEADASVLLRSLNVQAPAVRDCLSSVIAAAACHIQTGCDSRADGERYGWLVDVTVRRETARLLSVQIEAGQSYN